MMGQMRVEMLSNDSWSIAIIRRTGKTPNRKHHNKLAIFIFFYFFLHNADIVSVDLSFQ